MSVKIVVAEIKRFGPHQANTTRRQLRREPCLHVRTQDGESHVLIRNLPEGEECRVMKTVTVIKRSEIVRSSIDPSRLIERFEVRIVQGATLFGKKCGTLQNQKSQIVRFHRCLNPRSGWRINFGELPVEFQKEQRIKAAAPKRIPRISGSSRTTKPQVAQHRQAL